MPRDYIYDQGFSEERARLAGIESLWDPGSQAVLDALGIAAGWRCLEVGACGGSLVQWMAGRGATVTAIDIDTRFLARRRRRGRRSIRRGHPDADADDDRRDRPPLSRSRLLCAPTGGCLRRGCRLTDHA
jgi:hypothetical protein